MSKRKSIIGVSIAIATFVIIVSLMMDFSRPSNMELATGHLQYRRRFDNAVTQYLPVNYLPVVEAKTSESLDSKTMDLLLRLKYLETLNLDWCSIDWTEFEKLPQLPKLQHLSMDQCVIGDSHLQVCLDCPRLESIVVYGRYITADGLAVLAKQSTLKKVVVKLSLFTVEEMHTLKHYFNGKTLVFD